MATLQHGGQYGICVQGQHTFPNDSLWISDGPNRRGRRRVHEGRLDPGVDAFSDDVAGPFARR